MPKLKTEVTDEDFLKKTVDEQNLIMFKKLCNIDEKGCSWAQKRERKETKKNYVISAMSGLGGGALAVLTKMALWNK